MVELPPPDGHADGSPGDGDAGLIGRIAQNVLTAGIHINLHHGKSCALVRSGKARSSQVWQAASNSSLHFVVHGHVLFIGRNGTRLNNRAGMISITPNTIRRKKATFFIPQIYKTCRYSYGIYMTGSANFPNFAARSGTGITFGADHINIIQNNNT